MRTRSNCSKAVMTKGIETYQTPTTTATTTVIPVASTISNRVTSIGRMIARTSASEISSMVGSVSVVVSSTLVGDSYTSTATTPTPVAASKSVMLLVTRSLNVSAGIPTEEEEEIGKLSPSAMDKVMTVLSVCLTLLPAEVELELVAATTEWTTISLLVKVVLHNSKNAAQSLS